MHIPDSPIYFLFSFCPLPSNLLPNPDVTTTPAVSKTLRSVFNPSTGGQRPAGAQPSQTSAGDSRAHRAGELPSVLAEGGGAGGGARGDAGRTQPQQCAGQGHGRRPGLQVRLMMKAVSDQDIYFTIIEEDENKKRLGKLEPVNFF